LIPGFAGISDTGEFIVFFLPYFELWDHDPWNLCLFLPTIRDWKVMLLCVFVFVCDIVLGVVMFGDCCSFLVVSFSSSAMLRWRP